MIVTEVRISLSRLKIRVGQRCAELYCAGDCSALLILTQATMYSLRRGLNSQNSSLQSVVALSRMVLALLGVSKGELTSNVPLSLMECAASQKNQWKLQHVCL